MTKEQAIEAIQNADLSKEDWEYDIFQALPDYERGYVEGRSHEWNGNLDSRTEDYRDELLDAVKNLSW